MERRKTEDDANAKHKMQMQKSVSQGPRKKQNVWSLITERRKVRGQRSINCQRAMKHRKKTNAKVAGKCAIGKKLTQRGDFPPKRRNSGELQKRQGEDISRNETLTRGKVEERTGEYSSGLPMLPPPNTGDPLLGEQQEGKNSQRGN